MNYFFIYKCEIEKSENTKTIRIVRTELRAYSVVNVALLFPKGAQSTRALFEIDENRFKFQTVPLYRTGSFEIRSDLCSSPKFRQKVMLSLTGEPRAFGFSFFFSRRDDRSERAVTAPE